MDDQHYPIPTTNKPSTLADDDIMELLWQNGQVVMQSQNHRPLRKPPQPRNSDEVAADVQEDEMTSWLRYHQIDDVDPPWDQTFCADLLYAPITVNANNNNSNSAMQTLNRASQLTELPRPPILPARIPEQVPEFTYLARHGERAEPPGPSSSSRVAARESTVVDSCDTPVPPPANSRVSEHTEGDAGRGSMSAVGTAGTGGRGRGAMAWDTVMTSSPGGSISSGEPPPSEDRKRKGREAKEWECQSEDVDFESADAKKQVPGSTSTKRSRATEVHNLSERRRRDRINEKMRALQELIPRCNKSDKASMLDEAIEYLKSLQLQVQMMSMGCGMVPMMFPGIRQYMPAMGMGIGMGMGMEMGMNRPVMPFPNMLPAATAAAHLGPTFPMPPFHMPHAPAPDSSRMQAANQSDNNILTSMGTPDPNQSHIPNFTHPYQQYIGPHQMPFQIMQSQAMNQPTVSTPSTSRGPENPENHQSGQKMIL